MINKNTISNIDNKWFILCGLIASLFFTLSWIIQEAFRPMYNPLMHPISSLSYGSLGWIQVATFFITGVLILLFAYGVWETWKKEVALSQWIPIIVTLCGIAFIGCAIFTSDFANGYPAGTPVVITNPTFSGIMHQAWVSLLFFATPGGCFIIGNYFAYKRELKWLLYSSISGFMFLIFAFFTAIGFYQPPGFEIYAGLFQRITLTIGFLWIAMVSLYFFRK